MTVTSFVRPSSHDCDVKRPKPEERRQAWKLLIYGPRPVALAKTLTPAIYERHTRTTTIASDLGDAVIERFTGQGGWTCVRISVRKKREHP